MAPAVGIDLGTTYSAVAWVTPDGTPAVIADDAGDTLTPSVVSFAGPEPVVGAAAKADQARGEPDVAAFFKSSMGDPAFSRYLGGRDWTAAGLSGLVLAHIKDQAGRALGTPVSKAVITVPEYFTHPQRTATIEAGRAAGLDVLRIISEPTAAALAYGLRPAAAGQTAGQGSGQRGTGRFIVYDLGGGTFDVSVVRLTEDSLDVIAATGDHELGGRDWDDRIATELAGRFRAETGADLLAGDVGELLVAIEQLKRSLSARRSAGIRVSDGTRSARYTVTRAEFEAATADLLERTAQLTGQALSDAGLTWDDIDGVLPVGGSTRMPMVREWVERMSGRPPLGGIHPDHAVALGAAVQAALLTADSAADSATDSATDSAAGAPAALGGTASSGPLLAGCRRINDVVAHSLGMIAESSDRSRYLNSVLLKRNSVIPCQEVRPYHFDVPPGDAGDAGDAGDGTGSGAELEVFLTQGETDDPAESTYLGRYLVTGFPAEAAGTTAVIDIAYAYDENAVVTVSATQRSTGTALDVRVDELPDDVPGRFLRPPAEAGGRAKREPVIVYLAVDVSGSMTGEPLVEAKRAAKAFVSQVDLTTTAFGLIAVSDKVRTELTASRNAARIERAIDQLKCGSTGYGNEGQPFDEIHKLLKQENGRRFAIVLADGVWYNQSHAVERARRCHADNIDVIAIGFGAADEKFLSQIASATENSFFTSMSELTATFSTIARELTEGAGALGDTGTGTGTGTRGVRQG